MHKLCILGDSHIGSLKLAWDAIGKEFPDWELAFFSQAGANGLESLYWEDGFLRTKSQATKESLQLTYGADELEIAAHDYYLVYGLRIRAFLTKGKFFSKQSRERAIQDFLDSTTAHKVAGLLRRSAKGPVYVGLKPLNAYRGDDLKVQIDDEYLDGVEEMNDFVFSKSDIKLLGQPEETIVNGYFTHPDFSKGSVRFNTATIKQGALEEHPEDDVTHMNVEYGKIWLRRFLSEVAA